MSVLSALAPDCSKLVSAWLRLWRQLAKGRVAGRSFSWPYSHRLQTLLAARSALGQAERVVRVAQATTPAKLASTQVTLAALGCDDGLPSA